MTVILGRQWEWVTLVFASFGIGEGSILLELLGTDDGSEIGYSNGMSDGNKYGNLDRSTLGEYIFGSEVRSEVIYFVGS